MNYKYNLTLHEIDFPILLKHSFQKETNKIYYKNKPLFIQTPRSLTKQGFIKTNKKIFCDLLFDNNDNLFISWFETLENKIIELLYEKSSNWFENTIEKNDIESFFNSPIR